MLFIRTKKTRASWKWHNPVSHVRSALLLQYISQVCSEDILKNWTIIVSSHNVFCEFLWLIQVEYNSEYQTVKAASDTVTCQSRLLTCLSITRCSICKHEKTFCFCPWMWMLCIWRPWPIHHLITLHFLWNPLWSTLANALTEEEIYQQVCSLCTSDHNTAKYTGSKPKGQERCYPWLYHLFTWHCYCSHILWSSMRSHDT